MNQTAIAALQDFTGKEFMYSDWLIHVLPYTVIGTLGIYFGMRMLPMCREVKRLEGTKEFFKDSYAELGPMKGIEKFCLGAFVLSLVLAFTRTWYASLLPGLAPAYSMLTLGFICFFVVVKKDGKSSPLLTWEEAQHGMMWGMMLLFASGMAMGKLLNGTGASEALGNIISNMNLDGGLTTIIVLVVFTRLLSEVTNGTTAAAVAAPSSSHSPARWSEPWSLLVHLHLRLQRRIPPAHQCPCRPRGLWPGCTEDAQGRYPHDHPEHGHRHRLRLCLHEVHPRLGPAVLHVQLNHKTRNTHKTQNPSILKLSLVTAGVPLL